MTEPLMLPDYVTYGVIDSREIVGIVKIKTKQFITLYDFSKIKNPADKKELLSFAAIWWSQSNRTIPISIFIKNEQSKQKIAKKDIKKAKLFFFSEIKL